MRHVPAINVLHMMTLMMPTPRFCFQLPAEHLVKRSIVRALLAHCGVHYIVLRKSIVPRES